MASAPWVPLLRAFYDQLRDRHRRGARTRRRPTEATDEVCSLGHPMVIRLGRNGRFLACSLYPEHKETRPRARRRAAAPAGDRRGLPRVRRGHARQQDAAGSGRSSAARATPTASTSRRTVRRRPIRSRSRSTAPRTTTATWSRVARGGPGTSSGGARTTRRCDFTTNNEPLGGLHDTDDGPLARKGETAICLVCGSTSEAAARAIVARRARTRAVRRTRRRSPDRLAARGGARGGGRAAAGRGGRAAPCTARPARRRRATTTGRDPPGRAGRRRVSGARSRPATDPTLARFLRSLAARDASPHTQRAYATAVGAYLDWLAARGAPTGARPARTDLRAYLARPRRRPRPLVGRAAARGDPLVPSLGDPRRPRAGRPVGRDRDAAPAAPPAARPRGRAGRAAARRRRRRPRRAPWRGPARTEPRSGSLSRCATGRSSRPPTPPACASASWPRPTSARSTCAAARSGCSARAARSGSGCSAGRPGAALAAYLEDGRPVAARASREAVDAPPVEIFLNHLGEPLGVRGLRYRLDRLCARAGLPGRRLAAHAPPLVRDAPARRRRRPARRPGAARPREPRDDPGLHPRLAGSAAGGLSGGPSAGASRPRARERRPARSPAPGSSSRARSSSRGSSATSGSSSSPTSFRSAELDAFFAAFRIPDLIFQLVAAGALSSALIPIVSGLFAPTSSARAWRVVSTVINLMLIGLVVLAVGPVHRSRPSIVPIITPGFVGPKLDQTIELTRIMLLSPIFLALGRGRDERAQRRRPVRRVGRRADRLQPRDHRRGADPRSDARRRGPGPERRRRLDGPPPRPAPTDGAAGLPLHAADRRRRPAGAQGAAC